jgi:hypothetical protein
MSKNKLLLVPALLLWLAAGCCSNPEIFQKVHHSLETVQGFYDPLIQEIYRQDDRVRLAVVAADTTLLLAGELQQQWCPDPGKAQQLELQTSAAQRLAQEAGVPAAAPADAKEPVK